MARMHTDEVDIDDDLVRELVRVQFPEWADLPVRRLAYGGSTNAIFGVGTTLSARLPLTAGGLGGLHREVRALPALASVSPVQVPEVVAIGQPGDHHPFGCPPVDRRRGPGRGAGCGRGRHCPGSRRVSHRAGQGRRDWRTAAGHWLSRTCKLAPRSRSWPAPTSRSISMRWSQSGAWRCPTQSPRAR